MNDAADKGEPEDPSVARPEEAPRPGSSSYLSHPDDDREPSMRVPAWIPRLAPLGTVLVIVLIEALRFTGTQPPVPFLLLFASVVCAAALGGTRGGIASGLLATVYIAFAAFSGLGDDHLLDHPLRIIGGISVIMLASLMLGRLQDRNGLYFSAIRDEIDRRYRSLIRNAPEAICVLDFESGRMIDGNPRALSLFEMTHEAFTKASVADLSVKTQPDGRPSARAAADYVKQALKKGAVTFEWWHRSAGGRVFPCEVSLSRLPGENRPLVRGSLRDITARKRAEIQREGEHEVLESMASGKRLKESLDKLARVVERVLPDSICTIILLEDDGVHVKQGAGPGVSDAFRAAIDGASIGPAAGSCGTAMHDDRDVVTPDIQADPNWESWRPAADAEGLRACWSMPIHGSSGVVIGSFAVYYRQPREPDAWELSALSRMRNLAGIAIERYRAADELRHREALYRATFEHAAVGIAHVGPDGGYMRVNPKFCELVGYSEDELQRMNFRDVTHPEDVERDVKRVNYMLKGEQDSYHVEKRYQRKNGDILWVNLSAGVVRKSSGEVERFVVVVEDVSAARELSEQLSYQARHDSLTGLINRVEFELRLRKFLVQVTAGRETGAVCYLDLDQFKLVNDTVGHVAGDEVLRQLGPELQARIRSSDTIARLGGDEFGVLLRGCTIEDAVAVADKMRRAVEEYPFVWGDKTFKLGVSIGVVPLSDDTLNSVTEVLQAADTVCYVAKDSGRNRAVVWREDDASLYRRHGEMQWVPRLNRALEEDLFVLAAQPIMPLSAREAPARWYELLVRLNDRGEIVAPGAFLPAAERYGLAPRLDRLVVERALRWLRERPPEAEPVNLSVNLSGLSLGEEGFREFLTRALGEVPALAERICFEITETAAIGNLTEAASLIDSVRKLGCRIALDDFGSGLSSFAYLKNLPVDYLKIDGTFVRDVATDPIDKAIVQSIREVGRVMGKETIAEFVESQAIVEILRELEVDYAQGFWLGDPIPLDDIKC